MQFNPQMWLLCVLFVVIIHSVYFITGDTGFRSRAMLDVWDDILAMCRHRKVCHNGKWTTAHQGMFRRPVVMSAMIFEFVKSREFLDRPSVCRISRGTQRYVVSYFSSRLIGYLFN